jgi:hypothetical protein
MARSQVESANLVSAILAGSWRSRDSEDKSSAIFSESDLDRVTPLLYGSGAGALGWWRVRHTDLGASASAEVLHQAYRLQSLQAAIHETKVKKVFKELRQAGIDPLLFKGWSIARLYPDIALRAYGDIDICVRPASYRLAQEVVGRPLLRDCWIDLHDRLYEIEDRPLDEVFARSRFVGLGEERIRVPALEDHFALLAIHLLKHGGWRPLSLCDIGLLLESLPADFDWAACLGKTKRRANWIVSAIGLAQVLLDARIDSPAIAARAKQIPDWLVRSVLKQWEAPFVRIHESPPPMATYLRSPFSFIRELPNRWPNPIRATLSVKGQFNRLPRFPYQLVDVVARLGKFIRSRGPSMWHEH